MPKRLYKEDITESDTLNQTSSNLSVRKVKKPNLGERERSDREVLLQNRLSEVQKTEEREIAASPLKKKKILTTSHPVHTLGPFLSTSAP